MNEETLAAYNAGTALVLLVVGVLIAALRRVWRVNDPAY